MKKYRNKNKQTISAIQWTGKNTDDVIKFGTFKVGDKIFHDIDYPPYNKNTPELWISSLSGGDIIHVGDYVISTNNEFIKITQQELEKNWKLTGNHDFYQLYEKSFFPVYEAIQWTENNTKECIDFLNHNGCLDASGKQILIMNCFGGAICERGDYILRFDNDYGAISQEQLKKDFEEI